MMIDKKKSRPRKPYLWLGALVFLAPLLARAESPTDIMTLCKIPGPCADALVGSTQDFENTAWLKWELANGGQVNVLRVDVNNDTILQSDGGDPIVLKPEGDNNRLFTFSASSDTALTLTFGDGSALQILSILSGDADASDDNAIRMSSGGVFGVTRGAGLELLGNEFTSGGGASLIGGNVSTGNVKLVLGSTAAQIQFISTTGTTLWGTTNAGLLSNNSGGDLNLTATGTTVGIQEGTAASACSGTATANGTTAVPVTTTCVTTASRIFISRTSAVAGGVTEPGCWATNIVNGTSFDLDCNDAAENSTFNWIIFHEAS